MDAKKKLKDGMIFNTAQKKIFLSTLFSETETTVKSDSDDVEDLWGDEITEESVTKEYNDREVAFCPCCHQMSYGTDFVKKVAESDECDNIRYVFKYYIKADKYEKNEKGQVIMKCPKCNADLTGYPYKYLKMTDGYQWDNWEMGCYNILHENNRLVLTVFINVFFPNVNVGKLAVTRYNFRVVFNLETGQTYILEIRETDGKKRKPKWCPGVRITNCSYTGGTMSNTIINKCLADRQLIYDVGCALVEATNNKMENLFTKKEIEDINSGKKFFEEYVWQDKSSCLCFETLTIYNKFKKYNRNFINILRKWLSDSSYLYYDEAKKANKKKKRFLLKLSKVENEAELFAWFSKTYNIPNMKKIKKIIFCNPLAAINYSFILELGFKDYNVVLDILDNNAELLYEFFSDYNSGGINAEKNHEKLLGFISDLIELKGEPTVKNLIFNKDLKYTILRDTANMYHTFKRHDLINKKSLKGTIKEMHDKFSADYRKLGEQNLKISYDESVLSLNDEIDDFRFLLAKDTYQLIDVGSNMGICVGSYGRRAAENQLIIVIMLQNDKYVGCIELDASGKRLIQAKAIFNNKLQEKKAEALKRWVEKNEIDSNCWDYKHIAEGNIEYDESKIYQSTHNYAGYGMRGQWNDDLWGDDPFQ